MDGRELGSFVTSVGTAVGGESEGDALGTPVGGLVATLTLEGLKLGSSVCGKPDGKIEGAGVAAVGISDSAVGETAGAVLGMEGFIPESDVVGSRLPNSDNVGTTVGLLVGLSVTFV